MRNLIIIAMLAGVAFTAGWFTVSRDSEGTTIQFNRAEIRQDTRQIIEKGREILDTGDQKFANQQQQDPRYADRNGGYPQPDPGYQQPAYNQNGYSQSGYPQNGSTQNGNQYSNPNTGYRDPNQAPWNQNYGRPDPNAYDANNYQGRR